MRKIIFALLILNYTAYSQVGGIKISQLRAVDSLKLESLIPVVQDGQTKKCHVSDLVNYLNFAVTCDSVNKCIDTSKIATQSYANRNFWSLTGNAGTNPATNFIGTKDSSNFIIQPSKGNVGIGTITPKYKLTSIGEALISYVDDSLLEFRFSAADSLEAPAIAFPHMEITSGLRDGIHTTIGVADLSNNGGDSLTAVFGVVDEAGSIRNKITATTTSLVAQIKNDGGDQMRTMFTPYEIYSQDGGKNLGKSNKHFNKAYLDSLSLTDGSEGSGKVLASDATGNASWQTFALTDTATLDFGTINANGYETKTITVTGAALGDVVALGIPNDSMNTHASFIAWVSATNTVSVKCFNFDGSTFDPAAGVFKVKVLK